MGDFMGEGFCWQCPDCNYEFSANIGIGFLYPKVYVETIEAAKRGDLGDDLKELLDVYPNAAINPETVILQCSECGDYDARPILTAYVPKESEQIPPKEKGQKWSVAFPFEGASYVTSYDMEKYYDLYMEYDHRCKKCGGGMFPFPKSRRENDMICPICKKTLEIVSFYFWD